MIHLHIDPFSGAAGDMLLGMMLDLGVPVSYLNEALGRMPLEAFSLGEVKVVRHGISAVQLHISEGAAAQMAHMADAHKHPDKHSHSHDHLHYDGHQSSSHSHDSQRHAAHAHGNGHSHSHQHVQKDCTTSIEIVSSTHHHHHDGPARTLPDMLGLLEGAHYSEWVTHKAAAIFHRLASAEASIHGKELNEVHFHEINGLDTIIDVIGTCLALEWLEVERVTASPVAVGSGVLQCAHGAMPIPAPATAAILAGVPVRPVDAGVELCTPTGAAILVELVDAFEVMSAGTMRRVGYGAGTRELRDRANVIRGILSIPSQSDASRSGWDEDTIVQLTAVVDDASGEMAGYVLAQLLEQGALDAYLRPVTMKKSRPGWELVALVGPDKKQAAITTIFRQTGSLGVRVEMVTRAVLRRAFHTVTIDGMPVRIKCGMSENALWHAAPEFEDCASVARQTGRSLPVVMQEAMAAFYQVGGYDALPDGVDV